MEIRFLKLTSLLLGMTMVLLSTAKTAEKEGDNAKLLKDITVKLEEISKKQAKRTHQSGKKPIKVTADTKEAERLKSLNKKINELDSLLNQAEVDMLSLRENIFHQITDRSWADIRQVQSHITTHKVIELKYYIDDFEIFNRKDRSGKMHSVLVPVFDGFILPGKHTIKVEGLFAPVKNASDLSFQAGELVKAAKDFEINVSPNSKQDITIKVVPSATGLDFELENLNNLNNTNVSTNK